MPAPPARELDTHQRLRMAVTFAQALTWMAALGALACSESRNDRAVKAAEAQYEAALIASTEQRAPPPAWVRRIGEVPSDLAPNEAWRIVPATLADVDYATDERVPVRRVVYRVRYVVPPIFRHRRQQMGAQAGELQVDVGHRRLRARFVGPGWPLDEGSEVRMRDDRPGLYLFDGKGGRWLPGGRLATWFEGRADRPARSGIRVLRDYSPVPSDGPAVLVCELLAEWTNQPRDSLVGRCRGNIVPPGFRFGPWRAELTAVLPMELPRRELRADEREPPDRPAMVYGREMLSRAEMEQIEPHLPRDEQGGSDEDIQDASGTSRVVRGALTVHNSTSTRVVIIAQGLPIGFVEAGRTTRLRNLTVGRYRVGAARPFGVLVNAPTMVDVPGEYRVGRGLDVEAVPSSRDGASSDGSTREPDGGVGTEAGPTGAGVLGPGQDAGTDLSVLAAPLGSFGSAEHGSSSSGGLPTTPIPPGPKPRPAPAPEPTDGLLVPSPNGLLELGPLLDAGAL